MRRRIAGMDKRDAREEAEAVARTLFTLDEWNEARTVIAFVSMSGEIETRSILERTVEEEKTLALPRLHGKEMEFHVMSGSHEAKEAHEAQKMHGSLDELFASLVRHPYGLLEPPEEAPVFSEETPLPALVVTPGLAFDRNGNRLGRGMAYYDRWFAKHAGLIGSGLLYPVAIGYSRQLIEEVPADERDYKIPVLNIAGTCIRISPSRPASG